MRKLFAGAAAAALVTVSMAGMASAQDLTVGPNIGVPTVINDDAFVFNPPPAGGIGFLVSVDGQPSSFLIDTAGELSVDFGIGGLDGAVVFTPGVGVDVFAPRS